MKCPTCHDGRAALIDVRVRKNGVVRRRRECRKCGFRFTTYETRTPVRVDRLQDVQKSLATAAVLVHQLQRMVEDALGEEHEESQVRM